MWRFKTASGGETTNLKMDLQLLKSKEKKFKEELDSLLQNMQSSKRTFSQRILTCLINSDRDKYTSYQSGREVVNWMAINTDAKKIKKICHGAVPGPNDNLQELIEKHDSQEKLSSLASSTRGRSSVVKELWAKKGVIFSGTGPICPPLRCSIPVPQTPEEENYQINLALRESQLNTVLCSQGNQLSFSHADHARSISRAPDIEFSRNYTAVNVPCQEQGSSTYSSTITASEGNLLSLSSHSHSDQFFFSHASPISRAPDFTFSQDFTTVNVPCKDPNVDQSSTYASTKNVSQENPLSLLASAANLVTDNSTTEY